MNRIASGGHMSVRLRIEAWMFLVFVLMISGMSAVSLSLERRHLIEESRELGGLHHASGPALESGPM